MSFHRTRWPASVWGRGGHRSWAWGAVSALSQDHYWEAGAPESRAREGDSGRVPEARHPSLPGAPMEGSQGASPPARHSGALGGLPLPCLPGEGSGPHQAFTVNWPQAPSLTLRRGSRGVVLGGAPGPSLHRCCLCCAARGPRQTGRLERGSPAPTALIWDSEHGRGTCRATHPLGSCRGLGRSAVRGGSGQLQPWGPCMSRGGAGCWETPTGQL